MVINDIIDIQFNDDGTWVSGTLVKMTETYLIVVSDRGRERIDWDEVQTVEVKGRIPDVQVSSNKDKGSLSALGTSGDLWGDIKSGRLKDGLYSD